MAGVFLHRLFAPHFILQIEKNYMKSKLLVLLLTAGLLTSCGGGTDNAAENGGTNESAKKQITIKGSDTQLPLTQEEAAEYMKSHPDASISVVGGGSGVGITALKDGTTDIAMSSRDLKMQEKLDFKNAKKDIREVITSYDALAVIVNPKNKVEKLTREQIEGIFTGASTNWKEVGGADMKITVYSRESSSGTYEFFKEHVMSKKNYAANVLSMPATGSIIQSISQTEGAIGYVGLAYTQEGSGIKTISVSYDEGKTYVAPSVASAKDKTYPISRPLFFFYDSKVENKVKEFVDYVLSDEGQKIVVKKDYIPVK
jgi:phosphate transport system substrate-binding protein